MSKEKNDHKKFRLLMHFQMCWFVQQCFGMILNVIKYNLVYVYYLYLPYGK